MKKNTSLVKSYSLSDPQKLTQAAVLVKDYIIQNKLAVPIAGKNYVMVEGWQFAGSLMGLLPRVVKVEQIETNKWLAQVDIVNIKEDRVVSTGFALCSKSESKKSAFDEYAILSMAQTRAIGKAYRNIISWIIKLAGYEPTPAEEMKKVNEKVVPENPVVNEDSKKVEELKGMLKGKTDTEKTADLKKRTGIVIDNFKITEKHAGLLIASLLNSTVKCKK